MLRTKVTSNRLADTGSKSLPSTLPIAVFLSEEERTHVVDSLLRILYGNSPYNLRIREAGVAWAVPRFFNLNKPVEWRIATKVSQKTLMTQVPPGRFNCITRDHQIELLW